jgi:hypothetical protein
MGQPQTRQTERPRGRLMRIPKWPSGWASPDDALLWLNDRLGKSVAVSIEIERGDFDLAVLYADGELHHWTETQQPRERIGELAAGNILEADNIGRYYVGEAVLDLTDVRALEVSAWPSDPGHLTVRIDENTKLDLVEQQELPPS